MWNLKKGHDELCRADTDSQTLKNLWFPKETGWGWGDMLGVWDGNAIKLGCDDPCTTINVINSLSNNKKIYIHLGVPIVVQWKRIRLVTMRLWVGNPIKLDCDDHCITINVINSLSNKKSHNQM